MTMPTLIAKHRAKVLETAFKKSVNTLYQAYNLTKIELGIDNIYQNIIINNNTNTNNYYDEFRTVFEKNLKVTKKYEKNSYPIYNYNGTKLIEDAGSDYPHATKILADGSSYDMHFNGDGIRVCIHLFIDTNGPYKKPNKYGHDIFKFQIFKDNKLMPVAMTKLYTDEELENESHPDLLGYPCSINSKQKSNGAGCAYYAMNNINPDDNTKKYWENLP